MCICRRLAAWCQSRRAARFGSNSNCAAACRFLRSRSFVPRRSLARSLRSHTNSYIALHGWMNGRMALTLAGYLFVSYSYLYTTHNTHTHTLCAIDKRYWIKWDFFLCVGVVVARTHHNRTKANWIKMVKNKRIKCEYISLGAQSLSVFFFFLNPMSSRLFTSTNTHTNRPMHWSAVLITCLIVTLSLILWLLLSSSKNIMCNERKKAHQINIDTLHAYMPTIMPRKCSPLLKFKQNERKGNFCWQNK